MHKILAVALAAAALLSAPPAAVAADKGYRDILGLWCGSVSTYSITREQLTVTILSDKSIRKYVIESFEFTPSVVTMNWKDSDGQIVWTKFSDDGLRMAQLTNEAGPRREFRRC